MSTMPSTSTHRPADILDGPSFAPQWNAIEELDEVIEGDTAEAADADGVDADSYTRWLFSDEREEIRILLEASQKKTARIEAKFRREEEECTLADAIMVKIARDLTIKQLDIAIEVQAEILKRWSKQAARMFVMERANGTEKVKMATNAHCSLPKWALEEPSDKVKASIADEFKQDVSSNLLLMVLFLFVITDHADAFLSSISDGSTLDIDQLTQQREGSHRDTRDCFGLYAFSWNSTAWYIGRVGLQSMYERLKQHQSHGVNRIVRSLLEEKGWAAASKRVLVDVPVSWQNNDVPLSLFTKILEPIYIAFAGSLLPPNQMQFNLFDQVGWIEKASLADILRGWEAVVKFSFTVDDRGRQMRFPAYNDLERWHGLFSEAFGGKLAPASIARFVTGYDRKRLISSLPRPNQDAYTNLPSAFFASNGQPKEGRSRASTSDSSASSNKTRRRDSSVLSTSSMSSSSSALSTTRPESKSARSSTNLAPASSRKFELPSRLARDGRNAVIAAVSKARRSLSASDTPEASNTDSLSKASKRLKTE